MHDDAKLNETGALLYIIIHILGGCMLQPHKHAFIYYHFTWCTKRRQQVIDGEIEQLIVRVLAAKASELRIGLVAIGCVPDHVHVLVEGNTTISPALIAKEFKGSSSHLVNATIGADGIRCLYWQSGYSVTTVSPSLLPRVRNYVENQKKHHRLNDLDSSLES